MPCLIAITENRNAPMLIRDSCTNPYRIRSRAAQEKVTLYEMGRAFWHISKHRGFKSNRKADKPEEDTGLIKSASLSLREKTED